MGVYNFTENIGESLGPMVFSKIMVMEPLFASVSAFCAAVAASGACQCLRVRLHFDNPARFGGAVVFIPNEICTGALFFPF